MADHEKASTKHQRGTHIGHSRHSGLVISSKESHKFDNRSDRDDSYHSHGSFRPCREERTPPRGYPQKDRDTDRRRHSRYDHAFDKSDHHYVESEDRLSGLVMKDHWTSHDRLEIHSHERVGGAFYERESFNRGHKTSDSANQGRRSIRGQEGYDRKDELPDYRKTVHEKRHHKDNEYHQKSRDNYKRKEQEQQYEEAKSPTTREMSTSYHAFFYRPAHTLLLPMLPR